MNPTNYPAGDSENRGPTNYPPKGALGNFGAGGTRLKDNYFVTFYRYSFSNYLRTHL